MILSDLHDQDLASRIGGRATLDELFRRTAELRPDALALVDPPNRATFTDGPPRQLTYAQADRVVSAIAGRLRCLRLHTDSLVGLQIGNSVEYALTLLAILRAGMIAMPLPLLWRRADLVAAIGQVGARALIVSRRIEEADHLDLALQAAADVFSIRYVCGFGPEPPDGVIGLDDLFEQDTLEPLPPIDEERAGPASAHLAAVTWDVTTEGLVPVARSHAELVAAGLAVLLEGNIAREARILSTVTMASFGGLAVALVPWLLSGGTLVLHQPFDAAALAEQCASNGPDTIVVPGPLIGPLADAGRLRAHEGVRRVIGFWRAPERLALATPWQDPSVSVIDVQVFGEVGLLAARRPPDGRPAPIAWGPIPAPRGVAGAPVVAEARRTERGTIALGGPMVPRCSFPPGAEEALLATIRISDDGFIDTGYACRSGQEDQAPLVSGPPPGLVSVGGYRFIARDLQQVVHGVQAAATLAAFPDAMAGHRLAGAAPDPGQLCQELAGLGLNPLLVDAFRSSGAPALTAR